MRANQEQDVYVDVLKLKQKKFESFYLSYFFYLIEYFIFTELHFHFVQFIYESIFVHFIYFLFLN